MDKKLFAALALGTLLTGCASVAPQAIVVPENLRPQGENLAQIVSAKGVQIYECRNGAWAFVAPEATLFDQAGKPIGKHYAGPHWEAADGSKVIGAVKARADAQDAASIPWLLLGTKNVGPQGDFSKVTSIQRVATVGGIAPSRDCEAGARARVGYTADYYFFTR